MERLTGHFARGRVGRSSGPADLPADLPTDLPAEWPSAFFVHQG
jgi:hypothetical protein